MRTAIFLLCYLTIAMSFSNINSNSNIRASIQLNILISEASNGKINVILNHTIHHGSQLPIRSDSKTDKTRHTRKPGELSQEKCNEYYPSTPNNQTSRKRRLAENYNTSNQFIQTQYESWQYFPPPTAEPGVYFLFRARESHPKEFSHMALIGLVNNTGSDQWICGGSLISHNFVLTAAHCLISEKLIVRLGELDTSTQDDDADPHDFAVKKTFPHPQYNASSQYHDIGLLELEKQVTLSEYIGIACLDNRREVDKQEMLTITGWGQTESKIFNNYLLKANVYVVPHGVCNNGYKKSVYFPLEILDDSQICAIGPNREDTCRGDSGGPLQVFSGFRGTQTETYKIIGVTSIGPRCGYANTDHPGVYTRVHHYLSWIESIVWP